MKGAQRYLQERDPVRRKLSHRLVCQYTGQAIMMPNLRKKRRKNDCGY